MRWKCRHCQRSCSCCFYGNMCKLSLVIHHIPNAIRKFRVTWLKPTRCKQAASAPRDVHYTQIATALTTTPVKVSVSWITPITWLTLIVWSTQLVVNTWTTFYDVHRDAVRNCAAILLYVWLTRSTDKPTSASPVKVIKETVQNNLEKVRGHNERLKLFVLCASRSPVNYCHMIWLISQTLNNFHNLPKKWYITKSYFPAKSSINSITLQYLYCFNSTHFLIG
jgi:hypothetical protein